MTDSTRRTCPVETPGDNSVLRTKSLWIVLGTEFLWLAPEHLSARRQHTGAARVSSTAATGATTTATGATTTGTLGARERHHGRGLDARDGGRAVHLANEARASQRVLGLLELFGRGATLEQRHPPVRTQ